MTIRSNASPSSGTFDAVAPGSAVAGLSISMGSIVPRVEKLSAKVVVLAETDTLTLTAKWQVSKDGASWFDVANGTQNASGVALATGTAGADAAVSRVFSAPEAVYGWAHARIAVVVGVATGAVGDTYSFSYAYRQLAA